MKKLLNRIIGIALLTCAFSANAGLNGNKFSIDYIVDVALGLIPNASLVTVFGYSASTGNVTNVNIWETADVWSNLTAASTMELLSSSANDAAAGTGCRSVFIQGLDTSFNQISESVVPNGVSVVALVNSYRMINNATCLVTGSGFVNAGNITVRVTGAGSQQGYILAGAGTSRHGRITIPAGYTYVVKNIFLLANKTANAATTATLDVVIILADGTRIKGLPETVPNGSNPTITIPTGFAVPEKQTISFQIASVSTTGIDISVGMSGVLIKNP